MSAKGFPLIQVFSVSIHLNDQQSNLIPCTVEADGTIKATANPTCPVDREQYAKLYGTIDVRLGPFVTHELYKQSVQTPELIDPKNDDTISLSGPSSDVGCPTPFDLEMFFHLLDARRNLEISRGWLIFNCGQPQCYYNKRLASTIKGEHGWATVHYTLFPSAVQAHVAAKLIVNEETRRSNSCVVFGSLYVGYGGHDYRYEYQRKYYRNALFNKPPDAGEPLYGNSMMLPLSASFLAVPKDTSLLIEADLHVKCGGDDTEIATLRTIDEEIPQPQDFDFKSPSFKNIVGETARLEVTVSWSDVWSFKRGEH